MDMIKFGLRIVVLVCISFVASSLKAQNGSFADARSKAIVLTKFLELNHYQAKPVDDKLSREIFDQFINSLDKERMIFTQPQITSLEKFSTLLDDEIHGYSPWSFLTAVAAAYKTDLKIADSLSADILKKGFDYNKVQKFLVREKKPAFAKDAKEFSEKLKVDLQYSTLMTIEDLKQNKYKSGNQPAGFAELEKKARDIGIEQNKKYYKKILENPKGFENYISELYLDAITACFDPHTEYLSPQDKDQFMTEVSGFEYSTGIEVDENSSGQMVVASLVPGSPAWKLGDIHKGDVLIDVAVNSQPAMTVADLEEDDLYDMLNGDRSDKITLTIRQANGNLKTVSLLKEKIKNDENFVKGFLLNGKQKIGYIQLPGFYSDWESEKGSSCANDVAKEVLKLKEEKIAGLIIDLRYNGGGSLKEAIELAGIFINEGTLCVIKDKQGKSHFLRDLNRGSIYDGPLVVLVNEMSASASELAASVLQDYNRALIVGTRTYGKGSVQEVLPMDTTKAIEAVEVPNTTMGFVKVTRRRYYRVTGESVQVKGVAPDIPLPGMYEAFKVRESDQDFVLPNDTARKAIFQPLKALPISQLLVNSKQRIDHDSLFKSIAAVTNYYRDHQDEKWIELKWDEFDKRYKEATENLRKIYSSSLKSKKYFTAGISSFDKKAWELDREKKEGNTAWFKKLEDDPYLNESYEILNDWINIK